MQDLGHNSELSAPHGRVIVLSEANSGYPLKGGLSADGKTEVSNPKPFREGNWWWIRPWQDEFTDGRLKRKKKRMKLAPATVETGKRGRLPPKSYAP